MSPQPNRPQIGATNGIGFTVALFVRDRFGLQSGAAVPRLAPRVEPIPIPGNVETIDATAWDRWWTELTHMPAGRTSRPTTSPGLAVLFDEILDQARIWESDVVPAVPYMPAWGPEMLWRNRDRLAGRGPVKHDTEFVPVEGRWHRILSPNRLLVSVETWLDHDLMDLLLRPQMTALIEGPENSGPCHIGDM